MDVQVIPRNMVVESGYAGRTADFNAAIIGGGFIGLSVALELMRAGARVQLFESGHVGRGASYAAAGMLAPSFEAANIQNAHPALLDLCLAGLEAWPEFVAHHFDEVRDELGYSSLPTLACAHDAAQLSFLEDLEVSLSKRQISHRRLSADAMQKLEGSLSPDLLAGLELPLDHQVENRVVLARLHQKIVLEGCKVFEESRVASFRRSPQGDRLNVVLEDGRIARDFDIVVLTTGQYARHPFMLDGEAHHLLPDRTIVPVKGQMISVAPSSTDLRRVLRYGAGYIVPKSRRIVIGATSEFDQDDLGLDEQSAKTLLSDATLICPALSDAKVLDHWAGIRPGIMDHAPIIGRSEVPGVFLATGHYRNGILLGPLTGQWVANLIVGQTVPPLCRAFSPDRFVTGKGHQIRV